MLIYLRPTTSKHTVLISEAQRYPNGTKFVAYYLNGAPKQVTLRDGKFYA
jgi:hypothetical protein